MGFFYDVVFMFLRNEPFFFLSVVCNYKRWASVQVALRDKGM